MKCLLAQALHSRDNLELLRLAQLSESPTRNIEHFMLAAPRFLRTSAASILWGWFYDMIGRAPPRANEI